MFIHKTEDGWKAVGDFNNPATTVDKVCFGDINGDGHDEAVIGWGSNLNNSTTICVYYYENGKMCELKLEQSYTEMVVMDFDDDHSDEIFTASVTVGDNLRLPGCCGSGTTSWRSSVPPIWIRP